MFNCHINRKVFNFLGKSLTHDSRDYIQIVNTLHRMNDGFYKQNPQIHSKYFNIYESLNPVIIDDKAFNILIEINHKNNVMYMVNKHNKYLVH